jgi:LacI family transcriptional regulator
VRKFVERQKLRGVILLPPVSENDELTRALTAADCSYVRITYTQLDDPSRIVISNDRLAVSEVANYLVSLGHKRIGYIAGPPGFRSAVERLAGFREAMAARGILLAPELIVEVDTPGPASPAAEVLALNPRYCDFREQRRNGGRRVSSRTASDAVPGDPRSSASTTAHPRACASLTTIRLPIRSSGGLPNTILKPQAEHTRW